MRTFALAVLGTVLLATLSAADAPWSERIAWTGFWLFLTWVLYGMPVPGRTP